MTPARARARLGPLLYRLRSRVARAIAPVRMRVNVNPDGTLDEIVSFGFVHLEQMSKDSWFLDADGLRLYLAIPASKQRGKARPMRVTAIPLELHHEKDWARWERAVER